MKPAIRSLVFGAAAAAILAVPAQGTDFLMRCSGGTLRTCASFQVLTYPLVGGGTQVFVKVRNEGARYGSQQWGGIISAFGVMVPGKLNNIKVRNDYDSRGTLFIEGGATMIGNPKNDWHTVTNLLGNQIDFARFSEGAHGGIKGCINPNSNPTEYFKTCSTAGAPNPWVTFAFTTGTRWNSSDAELIWTMQDVGDGNPNNGNEGNAFLGGITGGGTEPNADPGHVTPEPLTVVLLGSGLAGLAAVRRRRRREEDGTES